MTQQLFIVGVFVVALAMLPLLIRWLVQRNLLGKSVSGSASKVISVVAVGPGQRVVSLEAGPEGDRRFFVLGVTSQSVTCLHNSPLHERPQIPSDLIQRQPEHVTNV